MDLRFAMCDLRLKRCLHPISSSPHPPIAVIRPIASSTHRPIRAPRSAFSFTEVLFAIMILGIGFIMIAAIFPVAIHQAKSTTEDTVGATIARGGMNYLQQIALTQALVPPQPLMPATDLQTKPPAETAPGTVPIVQPGQTSFSSKVLSFRDERLSFKNNGADPDPEYKLRLWNSIRHNLILPSDPRYAWTALYRRSRTYYNPTSGALAITDPMVTKTDAPSAQVFIIAMEVRNRPTYTVDDVNGDTFVPIPVNIKLSEGDTGPDMITFYNGPTAAAALTDDIPNVGDTAVAENSYIVISDDHLTNDNSTTTVVEKEGDANGRIYRLGQKRAVGTWELLPGSDMQLILGADNTAGTFDDIHENIPARKVGTAPAGLPAQAFLIGRGLQNSALPHQPDATLPSYNPYEGPVQGIAIYTGFVQAN